MVKAKTPAAAYSEEEALSTSSEYFGGDALAARAFVTKYALRDARGELLEGSPPDMHARLAKEFARVEAKYPEPMSYEEILSLLSRPVGRTYGMGPVVPQGSPMSAIGNENYVQSLSNCFVVDSPLGSYPSIMNADARIAFIQRRRGGVGVDVSGIRPKGLPVRNAALTSDGVTLFMERFSRTTREVAQQNRRGALMETISVHHPDVCYFVNAKRDRSKITGANVSVRVTDDFMRAVESDGEYVQRWPVDAPPGEAKLERKAKARDVWEQLMDAAWDSAEPGVLFWDRITEMTPADAYADKGFKTICTNPCGELPLNSADSCRLLVIDLTHFIKQPFTDKAVFDHAVFEKIAGKAQRLMDDLVDLELEAVDKILAKVESDPEPEDEKRLELDLWKKIRETCAAGRRTGLGITGFGDAAAMLNVRYGSKECVRLADSVYRSLCLGAYRSSVEMARQRGTFPIYEWAREEKHPFLKRVMDEDDELAEAWRKYGRRNIALTTTAPVGTVSMLTQTTSGIESAFLLSYRRRKKLSEREVEQGARVDRVDASGDKWQEFDVKHHGFQRWCDATGRVDVETSPYWKSTSADVDWLTSVDVQAAAQRWICHSISKTCNLPKDTTHDLVSEVYMRAWKHGTKGFTVYRDGSRDGVLVSETGAKFDLATRFNGVPKAEVQRYIDIGRKHAQWMPDVHAANLDEVEAYLGGKKPEKPSTSAVQPSTVTETHAPKRPKNLPCDVHRATVKGEQYLVLVGLLDGKPYEVFAGLSSRVEIPKKAKSGKLIKNGKDADGIATYNLVVPVGDDDELIIKDMVSTFANPLYGSMTRMLSLSLRHGVPVQFVVEQCQKHKHDDMQSFAKVVSRVLKSYIPDGTLPASEKKCSSCGSDRVAYVEGCVQCTACGNSKCG